MPDLILLAQAASVTEDGVSWKVAAGVASGLVLALGAMWARLNGKVDKAELAASVRETALMKELSDARTAAQTRETALREECDGCRDLLTACHRDCDARLAATQKEKGDEVRALHGQILAAELRATAREREVGQERAIAADAFAKLTAEIQALRLHQGGQR